MGVDGKLFGKTFEGLFRVVGILAVLCAMLGVAFVVEMVFDLEWAFWKWPVGATAIGAIAIDGFRRRER